MNNSSSNSLNNNNANHHRPSIMIHNNSNNSLNGIGTPVVVTGTDDASGVYTPAGNHNSSSYQISTNNGHSKFQSKNFLAFFRGKISHEADIVQLDSPATAVSFGRLEGLATEREPFIVIGLADGRILVAMLPLPVLRVFSSTIYNVHMDSSLNNVTGSFTNGPPVSARPPSEQTKQDHINTSPTQKSRASIIGTTKSHLGLTGTMISNAESVGSSTAPRNTTLGAAPETSRSSALLETKQLQQHHHHSLDLNANMNHRLSHVDEEPTDENTVLLLHLNNCASLQIHGAEVTAVSVGPTGLWIISTASDGSMFMTTLSQKAKENPFYESTNSESLVVLTDRNALTALKSRVEEMDNHVKESKSEADRAVQRMSEKFSKTIHELETRLAREVKLRDDIILKGREDHLKTTNSLKEQLNTIENTLSKELHDTEHYYERKIAQESLYLDKMKQVIIFLSSSCIFFIYSFNHHLINNVAIIIIIDYI